jgi:flagellar hook-associated protein 1 FlgK
MRLSTTGGQTLFDGSTAVRLSFDARGDIGPGDVYEPGAGRGVGTIFAQTSIGARVDLIERGAFRSGEIRAAIEMRDDVLVQAQRQLDELAAGLAVAGSQTRVDSARTGTGALRIDPAAPATNDVLSVGYVSGGVRRDVTVVIRNGGALDPALAAAADPSRGIYILDLGDPASRLALETALGLPVTHGPGGSWIQVGSAESLSLSRPATRSPASNGAYPLFVDGATRDTVFGGAHPALLEPTGLAQRLAVNPDVVQDPRRLNRRDVPAGDSTRAGELLDNVTKADRAFPPAAGVGGANSTYVAPLSDFARRVVETQGANSEAALRLDEGQKVALAAIESRFSESAGVNIDEEMGRLVQLQTAYGANARVMTAVRDMLDMLMRM